MPPPPAPPSTLQENDTPEDILRTLAKPYDLDPDLLLSVAQIESSLNPHVHPSNKGAIGLMQLMPATATRQKVNINDPYENALGGVRELADLRDRYGGDLEMMVRRYNGRGPETTDYARKVLGEYERRKGFAPGTLTAQLNPNDPNDPRDVREAVTPSTAKPAPAPGTPPPAPPKGWDEEHPWLAKAMPALETAADVGTGIAKGVGQTATNLGRLVHMVPGVTSAVDAFWNAMPGAQLRDSSQAFDVADEALRPTNTAQSIGKTGEQLAEWLVPGEAIGEAGTKLAATLTPSVAPKIVKSGIGLASRAAAEAAGTAGVTAAQGGSAEEVKHAAELGAALPVAFAGAGKGVSKYLETSAGKKLQQAIGATSQRYKAIAAKIAPRMLKEGLGGPSGRQGMIDKAAKALDEGDQALDAAMARYGKDQVDPQPVIDALERTKDGFRTTQLDAAGNAVLDQHGNPVIVPIDRRVLAQLGALQQTMRNLGPNATLEQLRTVRQVWDRVVNQAGGFAHRAPGAIGQPLRDFDEAWAKREATGALRDLLGQKYPDIAALNREWSFWKDVIDVFRQTVQRTAPQERSLGSRLLGGGLRIAGTALGGELGSKAGGAWAGAGAGLFVADQLQKAMATPGWRFMSSRARYQLAQAMVNQDAGTIGRILSRVIATGGIGQAPPPSPGAQVAQPPPGPAPGQKWYETPTLNLTISSKEQP